MGLIGVFYSLRPIPAVRGDVNAIGHHEAAGHRPRCLPVVVADISQLQIQVQFDVSAPHIVIVGEIEAVRTGSDHIVNPTRNANAKLV